MAAEKSAVMVQVVHVEFKPSSPDLAEKFLGDGISFFRNNLEGRFDANGIVEVHQLRAEVSSGQLIHIMRHDDATRRAIGPKPDEGQLLYAQGRHRASEKLFEELFDCSVDRPARKRDLVPAVQRYSLDLPAGKG